MMLVMVLAFLNAQLPVALLAGTFMKSVLFALPMAAVFHFVIMPRTTSYAELAPWLLLLFFPALYFAASANPARSMAANMSILLTNALISISTTPATYDFSSFANTYLGISGGFGVVLFLAYFFETRSPRRSSHRLMSMVLSQMSEWVESCLGPNGQLGSTSEDSTVSKQIVTSLGKLKKVTAQIDYRQCPSVSRETIDSIVHSLEVLGWHTFWNGERQPLPKNATLDQEGPFQKVRQWCIDSLSATDHAFSIGQPPAVSVAGDRYLAGSKLTEEQHPSPGDSPHELALSSEQHAATLQYYRSLTSAITDCQRQLNRVDWNRWDQNYF